VRISAPPINARIDAEGITDQAQNDNGADPQAATSTHRDAEPAASAAVVTVATVIDIAAAAEIIVTHLFLSRCGGSFGTTTQLDRETFS
jgi:hypothetical protein